MDKRYFSEKVAEWYVSNKRNLPWRLTNDPYKIWLSEIILQQTRVNQGLPYYLKFVSQFPDVNSLAAASEQEVLRLWQGLGYYTRARNLHKCAKEVVNTFKGVFPRKYEELLTLPGIGEYTAAAIASFSNKEAVAVLDGNVFRVLSRVFGVEEEITSLKGKKIFNTLANQLIINTSPDLHNQAVMEFGALWCTPKLPKCEQCTLQTFCVAAQNNLQHLLPVKAKAKRARKRYFYYFVLKTKNSIMMKKREEKDIWNGLYDFHLIEKTRATKPASIINDSLFNKYIKKSSSLHISPVYRHVLTHQIILARFIIIELKDKIVEDKMHTLKSYPVRKINDLPKPVLISRFLEDYSITNLNID